MGLCAKYNEAAIYSLIQLWSVPMAVFFQAAEITMNKLRRIDTSMFVDMVE